LHFQCQCQQRRHRTRSSDQHHQYGHIGLRLRSGRCKSPPSQRTGP
jgi:hypothetical protein